jgi:guanylate kinase
MGQVNEFIPQSKEPLLIVISGPSGVGKDSVLEMLKKHKVEFYFVVTATTRPPRASEVNGVDYIFLSQDQFAEMIEQDDLLEYSIVYNDFKGIPKKQVRDAIVSGKDVILRLDVQGAEKVRKLYPQAVLIFLTVPDEQQMIQRLMARKSERPEELKLRIATARQELKRINQFDYLVVNEDDRLDDTVDTILAIIRAEHHRYPHRRVVLD